MENNQYISTQTNELFTALAKAQGEMMSAPKESVNPFFKSKYAGIEILVKVSRPSLTKHGLCVTQQIHWHPEYKLVLRTILGHSSGQWIESLFPISTDINKDGKILDIQKIGGLITYIKRYSYAAIVGVVTGEDDDDGESLMQEDGRLRYPKPDTISALEQETLQKELNVYPELASTILTNMGISKLSELPKAKYKTCLEAIKRTKNKLEQST